MTEKHSGHKNFNEELPIPIPPVDQAWQSMQQKLDVELPVAENLAARSPMRHLWIKTIVIATTVATITATWWLYDHKHPETASSSENIVSDTNLVVTLPDTQVDSPSNEIPPAFSSPATNSKSHINNNNSITASSSSSQLLSPSLQSAKSSASSPHIVDSKQNTGQKNIVQPLTKQYITRQQTATKSMTLIKQNSLADTDSVATAGQESFSFPSPLSGNEKPAEKESADAKQTKDNQQPVKFNTYTSNRSSAETIARRPLQLALIQTPYTKYNTSLLHKADPLALRQVTRIDREKKWALYIQLNIPVPLYGDSIYFMGPGSKDQLYRNLIPALRVERKLWKGALSLDILPAVSAALNSSLPVKDSGAPWIPFDTSRTFLKQYGWGLAIQYQFLVHNRWQAGAGIQTSFLQKAVLYQTVTDTFGHGSSGIYPATPADRQDLSKMRINGMAELNYVTGKWQLGIRTLVPITRVSRTKDISARPLNLEFVIRRRVWTK